MRKNLILCLILFSSSIYSQISYPSLDSIVTNHLKELRRVVGADANIYVVVEFDNSMLLITPKDYFVEPTIPQKIPKGHSFMVKFLFTKDGDKALVKGINFRVKKRTRKKLELINMGNGNDYFISSLTKP